MPARALSAVATSKLRHWAQLLAKGALKPPFTASALELETHAAGTVSAISAIDGLVADAGGVLGAAAALRMLASERDRLADQHQSRVQLVWSGPEGPSARHRDTDVVVRELFGRAEREVLVAGFSIAQGTEVFGVLAERMQVAKDLRVMLCINIGSNSLDPPDVDAELAKHMERFWKEQWPWTPRVPVFFDPRALAAARSDRAAMHAKVVVVDREWALVTSANFTAQGQRRNIEAGVLLRDPHIARQLVGEFGALIRHGGLHSATPSGSQHK